MSQNPKNKCIADDIKDFILQWNNDFPIDRWWRKTNGVAFNSSVHREMSLIDMTFDFLEDQMYEESKEKRAQRLEDPYILGSGDFLYTRVVDQDMSDEEFDSISLDD